MKYKFRAWDREECKYNYYDLENAKHMARWANNMSDCKSPEFYTGLQDINKIEIYEGDIIEYKRELQINPKDLKQKIEGIVTYYQGCYKLICDWHSVLISEINSYNLEHKYKEMYPLDKTEYYCDKEFKVIGNINAGKNKSSSKLG